MPEDSSRQNHTPASNRAVRRREFLRNAALGTAAAAINTWGDTEPAHAEAAKEDPVAKPVAAEKDISTAWWDSLYARGVPEVHRGDDPRFIGMPVSGITTGHVNLGADGTLWHWDIFNQPPGSDFSHYVFPLWAISGLEQGFAIRLDGDPQSRRLAKGGFSDIAFRGEYPFGFVDYKDGQCPVQVALEAFSPFVPLQVDDSSLPATVMRITLRNGSSGHVTGDLTGVLENTVARAAEICQPVKRVNRMIRQGGLLLMNCESEIKPGGGLRDAGTMGLALLSATEHDDGIAQIDRADERLVGSITRKFSLAPGQSHTAVFAIVWCFPNLSIKGLKTPGGRHYGTRFDSAIAVAHYLAMNFDRLYGQTKAWHDAWYGSTLPHWILQRTLLNVSTLATSTAMRFSDGRFYGNEGVIDAPGTCTHVWHYEQAMGRLFPELDRLLRERADFNPQISFKPDGMIDNRGEFHAGAAVDGQAGTILRTLRDHQTSPDDRFLKRNWAAIRKATEWLIEQDGNADGILEGTQHNTLDAEWYGAVAWLSGLYLAALRAAEVMALDCDDAPFAQRCRQILETGQRNLVGRLFNGAYFINQPDPRHPQSINSGDGCEIDQVLGQSWAFQVGLGRVFPETETRSALAALWQYNFVTDVGPYRASNRPGRWFALPGDAGLLMCAFPRAGGDSARAKEARSPYETGYFNECMTGFEHQVAAHMIWEGMVKEGLAIERAIHDRYDSSFRNPWNEVEYGDHYARAMASYGVFIAVCGFEYHGPKGHIAFSPRLTPEDFRCAFTGSEGWGTFHQTIGKSGMTAAIALLWGTLHLKTLALTCADGFRPTRVEVLAERRSVPAQIALVGGRAEIRFSTDVRLREGETLSVILS